MMKTLEPAERLIIAADYKPTSPRDNRRREVRNKVLELARNLSKTGVYIKVNSALRTCGYNLIYEIQQLGLKIFADLKLYDIPEILSIDGILLEEFQPEILTVACPAGKKAMSSLKAELPKTEVLGVTVLTSVPDSESWESFGRDIETAVNNLAVSAKSAGMDGVICSPKEAKHMRLLIGEKMTINTPAIRPKWAIILGDDQNLERVATPAEAIGFGADRIVVGRPITRAENPYYATMRTIEEIFEATLNKKL